MLLLMHSHGYGFSAVLSPRFNLKFLELGVKVASINDYGYCGCAFLVNPRTIKLFILTN